MRSLLTNVPFAESRSIIYGLHEFCENELECDMHNNNADVLDLLCIGESERIWDEDLAVLNDGMLFRE